MAEVQPRYIWGSVGPTVDRTREEQYTHPQRLLPEDVIEVSAGLGLKDYTVDGVEDAMSRYWDCVDALVEKKAQSISLGGVPISAQLGRPRVLELIEATQQKTGLPADATNEAIIAALQHLRAQTIAVASRWTGQLNEVIMDYFTGAGFTIASMTDAGQWAREAFSMSLEQGVVLAIRLGREALRQAPNADALFLPGGAWHSLAAVPILEDDFDVPVVTNDMATVWRLMNRGIAPPIQGWGRLLEKPRG